MKSTSNLIMWLTVFLVVSLAMIWVLVLLLLAELYCFPLIPRRRHRQVSSPVSDTATPITTGNNSSLVYISNPLYVEENVSSFETTTTDSLPTRLETEDYSGDDEREEM
ncbi:hypothetical protein L1987_14198 [Smallanthus sonchifolius]|uniref:Uncharacterized protein n=1 Tax=Smallanthus sonchifolius TaxID=185202 RepID=A0ACB9J3P2_9ASTR|nr:hypothetical protein L1987_14198 [Smallanthus sonchifolius]